jgi:hypothetical protein
VCSTSGSSAKNAPPPRVGAGKRRRICKYCIAFR